jgi:hypothetical protein
MRKEMKKIIVAAVLILFCAGYAGNLSYAQGMKSRMEMGKAPGEVVSRLKKDWAADINFYDKGHVHMLAFADALTEGIVKQFPDKFKK